MSAPPKMGLVPTNRRGRGAESQDFELNIASIIDCFTVLITFLLASASFLSIGLLDAGVAAAGNTAASKEAPPPVNVTIELGTQETFTLKISGKKQSSTRISAKGGSWDYDGLTAQLGAVKAKWPTVAAVTVIADNNTQYKDVVKAMEAARKTLPYVLLGGF